MPSDVESVEQTDLAATLAVLMGVPIPTTSMGRVISSTLKVRIDGLSKVDSPHNSDERDT